MSRRTRRYRNSCMCHPDTGDNMPWNAPATSAMTAKRKRATIRNKGAADDTLAVRYQRMQPLSGEDAEPAPSLLDWSFEHAERDRRALLQALHAVGDRQVPRESRG